MSADCLFCKIAAKKIPAKIVYEDEDVFAFEDINPQAPVHLLICPKKHFESLHHASAEDLALVGKVAGGAGIQMGRPSGVAYPLRFLERVGPSWSVGLSEIGEGESQGPISISPWPR